MTKTVLSNLKHTSFMLNNYLTNGEVSASCLPLLRSYNGQSKTLRYQKVIFKVEQFIFRYFFRRISTPLKIILKNSENHFIKKMLLCSQQRLNAETCWEQLENK